MRWLFLLVLFLNLAYIAWEMSKPSDEYVDVPALKNVQPIVLLSELKQQPSQPRSMSAEKGKVIAGEKAGADSAEKMLAENARSAKQLDTNEVAAAKVVAIAQEKTVAQEELPVESSKKTDVIDVVQTDPGQEEVAQAASCYTLGPFRDLDNLRGLTREIKSYVVKADFRGREEKEQTLYWVYIKPEKTRSKAIETGKRLKAKKIKDFYVIRKGEKENGLSLGHFRNKDGAYSLAKKVQKLGFDVMVEPVFRVYTVYWLDYQLSSGVSIPESIFEKYIKTTKKDKISRLSRDCGA
jgi:hypothetical protein